MSETRQKFREALERIATDLVTLFRLEFKQEIQHLSDPLFRWLDFRLRFIDPLPRSVLVSKKFPKRLPVSAEVGLHIVEKRFRDGMDINPYQSKSLIRFNDLSGEKRAKRTDFLWADWGITHLHLSDIPIPEGEYFSLRTCSDGEAWLLFCIVVENTVGFIDVRKHDDESVFSDLDLIRTVKDSWPDYMEQFKLKDILPGQTQASNEDIACLRKNGISLPACIDGDLYLGPGMGITTASTPLRVADSAHRVLDWVKTLADLADDSGGPFCTEAKRLGVAEPKFELCLTPKGIALYESKLDTAFVLASRGDDSFSAHCRKMENLIFPEWVRVAAAQKFLGN